ncbi:MAG TPA: GNAT family N-acetyltransferase [Gaiellaceae bacterium]|jgi:RimJ/RimL family protein N-acetyltransferase
MARVREATVDELPQVCAALAAAFVNDPVLLFLFPRRWRRDARMRRLFAVELAYHVFPAGRALTTDDFRGASLELPPGTETISVPLAGAVAFLRALGANLPRAARLQKFFELHHIEEPHYYIRYIGVAPPFQGQGLGAELLRPTLDRCDRAGVPAYLEASSERSARFYARLGFEHLGELQVPDGPRFWPMRRPPART